jgi:hypothetical protein
MHKYSQITKLVGYIFISMWYIASIRHSRETAGGAARDSSDTGAKK